MFFTFCSKDDMVCAMRKDKQPFGPGYLMQHELYLMTFPTQAGADVLSSGS
jgi:hypothetical protein